MLDTTVDALADDCMSGFGFGPGSPASSLEDKMIAEREARNRLFGIIDVEQARLTGFLPAYIVLANEQGQPVHDPVRDFVLTGIRGAIIKLEDQTTSPGDVDGKAVPPNGCLGEARSKVFGSNSSMMPFVIADDLDTIAWEIGQRDARVVDADGSWQDCMASKGFPVGPMWEMDIPSANMPEEQRPTDDERRMAVAAAECNQQTGYADTFYRVLVELENRAVDANQPALTEERLAIEAALARASEVAGRR